MTDHRNKVKAAGYRMTRARQAVLDCLQRQDEPQTAAAIYRTLGERIDLTSVYRTVELLEKLGLVTREQQDNLSAYTLFDHHHHHIVCRTCDVQTCLPCNVSVRPPNGFSAVHHQVMLTGVCATCTGK